MKEKNWKDQLYKSVNKYELYDEIEKSQKRQQPTQKFMELIYRIANKISRSMRFMKYTEDWKDEAISGGAIKAIEQYMRFDLSYKESAYSYFHSVVKNGMLDVIKNDYTNYHKMKKELLKVNNSDANNDNYFDNHFNNEDENENAGEVIKIDVEEYDE